MHAQIENMEEDPKDNISFCKSLVNLSHLSIECIGKDGIDVESLTCDDI